MKIVTEHEYGTRVCVMRIQGEIDMTTVPDVQDAVEAAANRGCVNVVFDLARVSYLDSSALGLMVWADRLLDPRGGRIVLAGADRNVARVLEISGLIGTMRTLTAAQDAAEAVAGLRLPIRDEEPEWTYVAGMPATPAALKDLRSQVCDALVPLEVPEATMFDVRVAVGEALSNAIRHGSPGADSDDVEVRMAALSDRVIIEVTDSGGGFDGETVAGSDPYAASGRGVMFMRALMDDVRFTTRPDGGTTVRLVKHLAGADTR